MLASIRRARSSWIVGGILGLVMIAFVITGVERRTGGDIPKFGEQVATIGDDGVGVSEVDRRVQRELSQLRQQQPDIDFTRFERAGDFDALLDQLITSKAMVVFGQKVGLVASKRMVDGEIASIPAFQNAAGHFEENVMAQALQGAKFTQAELRDEIKTQSLQRQLLIPVAESTRFPESLARHYAGLLLETRTGSVGIVPARLVGPGKEPTDAEVAAFFKQKQNLYRIPERRVLRYAAFGQTDIVSGGAPTEAEIAKYYQDNAANYAAKETRTLSQVVLADENAARAFSAKIAGGKSFVQAASEAGLAAADITIGTQSKADLARLSSPAVANAAFAAAKGGTTPPTRSPLGWHILHVNAVNVTPARPLAAVRGEIATTLTKQKRDQALADLVARVEDKVADGASFEEVVRENKLNVIETPPLTASGTAPGIPGYQPSPEVAPLLKTAFQMEPDDDPTVETITPSQRFALLALSRVVESAPPPLAAIKDQVKRDLILVRAAERSKALAEQLAAKANGGTPIREAFARAGVALPPIQTMKYRRIDMSKIREVPPPLKTLFSLPKGKTQILAAPNGAGWWVIRLDEVVPGDISKHPDVTRALRSEFDQALGREYGEQFSRAAARAVDVQRDTGAISRLKAKLQGNASLAE